MRGKPRWPRTVRGLPGEPRRRRIMKLKKTLRVRFEERPRIVNRSDAMELLDVLIKADFVENIFFVLEALGGKKNH
jgi:hypothetical protein